MGRALDEYRDGSLLYLASPYSHVDEVVRRTRYEAACHKTADLMRQGFLAFSPVVLTHPLVGYGLPSTWDYWNKYDTALLERADALAVLTLPGWRESVGVTAEIEIADRLGKPIIYLEDADMDGSEAGAETCRRKAKVGDVTKPCKDCGGTPDAYERKPDLLTNEKTGAVYAPNKILANGVEAERPEWVAQTNIYMAVDPVTGAQKGQKRARFDLLPWPEVRLVQRRAREFSIVWPLTDVIDSLILWWWEGPAFTDALLDAAAKAYRLLQSDSPEDVVHDAGVLWDLAEVYGANAKPLGRYEPRNWEAGMAWSVPFAAAMRHAMLAAQGEKLDLDDGLPHMTHFLWHCIALLFYRRRGLGTDDRPPKYVKRPQGKGE